MPDLTCPLCGTPKPEMITDTVRFDHKADVYRCNGCSLTFLDQDSFTYPKDFYEKEYHQTYITHVEPDAFDPAAYFEKMTKATKPWADRFRKHLTGKETVLDVGCSTGHFMELIKDKTAAVYGHDLNKAEVAYCRDVRGLDVSDAPLDQRFKPGTFDYITMIFVLEHIAQPREFLTALSRLLKPGGRFVILVPNVRDPLVSYFDIPEFRAFYYCIEHLFYYDQKTITDLFDSVSMEGEVNVLQEYPIANHLNWAYRRRPSDTLAARRGVPDVDLATGAPAEAWEGLWKEFNDRYQDFLAENGYGDRLWCLVGPK